MDTNTDETVHDVPWSRWYRAAREEAAFRYGLRGIPTDEYKTEWAMGCAVIEGVRNIAKRQGLAGHGSG
jgi:hypothetical protein